MATESKTNCVRQAALKSSDTPKESKKAQLIRMLAAKAGADVAAISEKLGWLPHTTRAAISGLKKAGYDVTTERPNPDKPMRYRIAARPKAPDPAATAPEPAHAG